MAVLIAAAIGAGLAEAAVLALVADVAAAMVVHARHLQTDLGPFALHIGVAVALGLALSMAVCRLLLQLLLAWLPAKISADIQARLRRDLFDSFTRASWAIQAEEREGHLQELMTSQVMQATQLVMQIIVALSGSVMFVALVGAAFLLNSLVALIILATAIVLFCALRPIARLGRSAARELSDSNLDHAAGISEAVRLAEEVHVFGAADAQRLAVGRLIEGARRAFFRFYLAAGLVTSTYQSLVIVLILGGLSGLYFTNAGHLAALGAVVLMLVRASSYAQQFQGGFQSLNQILPYLDRLQSAASQYSASALSSGDVALPTIEALEFRSVTFSYRRGQPVLRDVSFVARAGEAIGIVGPSGAGKSTLVQLLLHLRSPDDGAYLINGMPTSSFRREDWQRRVAYVSQDPRIMHASVAENIRFFRKLGDAAVEEAARLAHIHDDIMRLPMGYDTVIGQRADAVSGGQRQRICLARALASNPDVLVLDEPTSALDMASEAAVQASLAGLQGAVTLFVVAHRISTLTQCDRVLVMAAGAVENFAPLAELERTSAYYRSTVELARGSR